MKRTVEDFFKHEISEMHKNIDRIKHSLQGRDLSSPALAGQCELLNIQQEHLAFLESIARAAQTYSQATTACRDFILTHEQIHLDLSQKEDTVRHSIEWWHSLHQVQFGTDILHRIEVWQQDYEH